MPSSAPKISPAPCPECGERFTSTDPRRLFCTNEHKRAWNNRQMTRFAPLGILAQAWRQGRHKKGGDESAKFAFAEFCNAVDRFNAEDKEAGRTAALEVLRGRYRRHRMLGIT